MNYNNEIGGVRVRKVDWEIGAADKPIFPRDSGATAASRGFAAKPLLAGEGPGERRRQRQGHLRNVA